jgi:copper chaperone NosL
MTRPSVPWLLGVALSALGALLLVMSLSRPWWGMVMYAPQYPQGLLTIASLRDMTGDVDELNELNHYIGMMDLNDAAKVERAIAPYMVWAFAALALAAVAVRKRWAAWLMRAPLLSFPAVFLADLKFWLWYAGNHLDPKAALSNAVKGFTPVLFGAGKIAQFRTQAWVEPGFWLALGAVAAVAAAGLLLSWQQRSKREV